MAVMMSSHVSNKEFETDIYSANQEKCRIQNPLTQWKNEIEKITFVEIMNPPPFQDMWFSNSPYQIKYLNTTKHF